MNLRLRSSLLHDSSDDDDDENVENDGSKRGGGVDGVLEVTLDHPDHAAVHARVEFFRADGGGGFIVVIVFVVVVVFVVSRQWKVERWRWGDHCLFFGRQYLRVEI